MAPAREGRGFLGLSHLTPSGEARMVDVSPKRETAREAVAQVIVKMRAATLHAIRAGQIAKGDVLGVALTAAAVAGLTVYDMVKAVDRGIVLSGLCLLEKRGGKSGAWRRKKA